MGNDYFNFSFDDTLDFLLQQDSDIIASLCDKYNIDVDSDTCVNELAEVISDSDLVELGFKMAEEAEFEEAPYTDGVNLGYQFNNVEDIAKFLSSSVEDFELMQLMNQYACTNLTDLAVALTDSELESLHYKPTLNGEVEIDNAPDDIFDGATPYHGKYDDNLDYLEDIPFDIPFYLIDGNYEDGSLFAVDDEVAFERFKESLNPVLVDECKIIPESIDGTNRCLFTVKPHKFEVSEEVIINDKLNEKIFDQDHKMIPDVKEKILNYVTEFADKMTKMGVDINFQDVRLIGSNAGYLYKPDSDIDVHLVSSLPLQDEKAEQLFEEFDLFEAENPLMIGEHKVELGIEDGYNIKIDNKNPRIYSIIYDEWVEDSDKNEEFKPEDITMVEGYEEETDKYDKMITDAIDEDNYTLASKLKAEIRQNRSDDLASIGSLSMGNVVFKELRERGTYGRLRDYLNSKELEMANNE